MLVEGRDSITGLNSYDPLLMPTNAKIQDVDDLYVFGDSLSDIGNVYNLTTIPIIGEFIPDLPPSPPYFDGRFTNGPTWVEILSQNLDAEKLTASTDLSLFGDFDGDTVDRSVNFAYGGAESKGNQGISAIFPDVLGQIEQFAEDSDRAGQAPDPEDLFVILAGANDYLFDPNVTPEEVVDNLTTGIESLSQSGAQNFLISNLPDLGKIPGALNGQFSRSSQTLTDLSDRHNNLLAQNLNDLDNSLPDDVNIVPLDVNDLFDRVVAGPQNFGLTNVTQSALTGDTIVANPNEYLFWDDIHPTATGHRLIAELATTVLS
jgi:phospholipase/lecithinase/hemolysin